MKSLFMLDPDVVYLNHGSYGACPKPIFDTLIHWQQKLENEPVKHLTFDIYKYLEDSRSALSDYVKCDKDDIVFFPNPSTALNTVLRSLDLKEGDEILTTDHEYGAMDRAWNFLCKKRGSKYIKKDISLPLISKEQFLNEFVKGITHKTKVIFMSHITSSTALIFPVKEICDIARSKNIITIIDGAHAPAQIDLDIMSINPDFYSGACHKWMCSPKGVAFLYAKRSLQSIIDPLVISWGYDAERPSHSQFLDYLQWQGTNDLSAYLTMPKTIEFLKQNDWKNVTNECRELNLWARDQIIDSFNMKKVSSKEFLGQMCSFYFQFKDPLQSQIEFYKKYKIQIPFIRWNNNTLFRISIQSYNTKEDIYKFIESLQDFRNC